MGQSSHFKRFWLEVGNYLENIFPNSVFHIIIEYGMPVFVRIFFFELQFSIAISRCYVLPNIFVHNLVKIKKIFFSFMYNRSILVYLLMHSASNDNCLLKTIQTDFQSCTIRYWIFLPFLILVSVYIQFRFISHSRFVFILTLKLNFVYCSIKSSPCFHFKFRFLFKIRFLSKTQTFCAFFLLSTAHVLWYVFCSASVVAGWCVRLKGFVR